MWSSALYRSDQFFLADKHSFQEQGCPTRVAEYRTEKQGPVGAMSESVRRTKGRRHAGATTAAATDSPPLQRLSLVSLLLTSLCLTTLFSPSHALRCNCNDQSALSDCRFQNWTCNISLTLGECFTRKNIRNGIVVRDVGCVLSSYNPTFCNTERATETYAVECCANGDFCNQHLDPPFLPPPPPPTSSGGSAILHPVPTIDGSGVGLAPTPSPTPPPPPNRLLQCDCSSSVCHQQTTCTTSLGCYKKVSSNDQGELETENGCWGNELGLQLCDRPVENLVFGCCSDYDMCNRDLNVSLPGASPPSNTDSTTASPTAITPKPQLKCKCSLSVCHNQDQLCFTDYKCFKETEVVSAGVVRTRFGCMESSFPTGINICAGIRNGDGKKTLCCDHQDMCNDDLEWPTDVDPEETTPPLIPTVSANKPSDSHSSPGEEENVYIILSTAVVLVTLLVIIVIFGTVVVMFYLRYQRAKTQVTSVDHLAPSGVKKLSNGSINCPVTQISVSNSKDHTDINCIVQYSV